MDVKNNRKGFGSLGEEFAAKYLANNGYEILERNFRFGRLGEIDIIAREKEFTCFLEVKTRSSLLFGYPSESVTLRKQYNIKKLAQVYMKKHNIREAYARFDVVEIIARKSSSGIFVQSINVIRNAYC